MNQVSQFVSRVISFTSQYSDTNWRASNIVGAPTLNNVYGDNINAWCPSSSEENQTLELAFDTSVYPKQVKIYENYHGGAVTRIEALNGDVYETIWSCNEPTTITAYNIFTPELSPVPLFATSQLRLTLNFENRNLFSELEAVELIGVLINLEPAERTLSVDLLKMLDDAIDADVEIETNSDSHETVKAHKCLLAIRCPHMLDYLRRNEFRLAEMSLLQVRFLLEFIYTDDLNERTLKTLIDSEKEKQTERDVSPTIVEELNFSKEPAEKTTMKETGGGGEDEDEWQTLDFNSSKFKWMAIINDFIRYSIEFKLHRLENLLINYLINNFLTTENVLYVIMDAIDVGNDQKRRRQTQLGIVEEACLCFIKLNIKKVIKTDEFKLLPKSVLIKIVTRL
jgi:hypothetical protein